MHQDIAFMSQRLCAHKGGINAQNIEKEILDYMESVFYTCGPPRMVEAMEKLLKDFGARETQIKKENFLGY